MQHLRIHSLLFAEDSQVFAPIGVGHRLVSSSLSRGTPSTGPIFSFEGRGLHNRRPTIRRCRHTNPKVPSPNGHISDGSGIAEITMVPVPETLRFGLLIAATNSGKYVPGLEGSGTGDEGLPKKSNCIAACPGPGANPHPGVNTGPGPKEKQLTINGSVVDSSAAPNPMVYEALLDSIVNDGTEKLSPLWIKSGTVNSKLPAFNPGALNGPGVKEN